MTREVSMTLKFSPLLACTYTYNKLFLYFQIFGPFLQLGAVLLMTLLSWVIVREWFKLIRLGKSSLELLI